MKYTDSEFGKNIPKLFLGQVTTDPDVTPFEIQVQKRIGDTVVYNGIARSIGELKSPEQLDVEPTGQANNCRLVGRGENKNMFLGLKGFKPSTVGLGAIK